MLDTLWEQCSTTTAETATPVSPAGHLHAAERRADAREEGRQRFFITLAVLAIMALLLKQDPHYYHEVDLRYVFGACVLVVFSVYMYGASKVFRCFCRRAPAAISAAAPAADAVGAGRAAAFCRHAAHALAELVPRYAHNRPGIPNTDSMDSLPSQTVPGPAPSPHQSAVQQASAAKATPLADVCIVQRVAQLPQDMASASSSRSSHCQQHRGRAGSSKSHEFQPLLESDEGGSDSTFSQAGGETDREADTPRPHARRAIFS